MIGYLLAYLFAYLYILDEKQYDNIENSGERKQKPVISLPLHNHCEHLIFHRLLRIEGDLSKDVLVHIQRCASPQRTYIIYPVNPPPRK